MAHRLQDRVALITGGGAGIGEATARLFVEEGAAVVLADQDEAAAASVAASLREQGGRAVAIRTDVARELECARAVQTAVDTFGRLDVLVANAGMRVYGPITAADEASWDAILAVNLKGVAFCAKHAVPVMANQGGGTIVVVSSANAVAARPGMAQYDATKAAVLGLVRAMACDHAAQGIRVNAACPGPTVTPFHVRRTGLSEAELLARPAPHTILGRQAHPREIACGILFLACDESSYVTGTALMVDGGLSAK